MVTEKQVLVCTFVQKLLLLDGTSPQPTLLSVVRLKLIYQIELLSLGAVYIMIYFKNLKFRGQEFSLICFVVNGDVTLGI